MEDDDNADELGESGGMRARPQPRKPSTQEVEAHMVDHYPFRSWCRYCVVSRQRQEVTITEDKPKITIKYQ